MKGKHVLCRRMFCERRSAVTIPDPHTEKKYLFESKKIICLNNCLWFKEMICLNEIKFVWFKQNIFEPNKYLFESNNFSSKQTN